MDYLEQKWKSISSNLKMCFMSGIIGGFLVHFYAMVHILPNWDTLNYFKGYGGGGELGRYMLRILHPVSGTVANPWVNVSLSIFWIALSSVFVYKIVGLKSRISAVLLPLLFVSFPAFASTTFYVFCVDLYFFAIFLSVLTVWIAQNYRFGFLYGIPVLIISMAIYQNYVCFTITLLLMGMLKLLLAHEESAKETLIRGIKYIVLLGAGVPLYILTAWLRYPALFESEYNGIGGMGQVPLWRIPRLIVKCYLNFADYFVLGDFSFLNGLMKACNLFVILFLVAGFVVVFCKELGKVKEQKGLWIFLSVIVFMLLPLGAAFIWLMAPDSDISLYMRYQFVLVYGEALFLAELLPAVCPAIGSGEKKRNVGSMAAVLLSAVLLLTAYENYSLTGEVYVRVGISYERVYNLLSEAMERVESQPDYQVGDPVYVLGTYDRAWIEGYELNEDRFLDFTGFPYEDGMFTPGARENFIRIFLGKEVEDQFIGDYTEAAREILDSEEYQSMNRYPSDDCVKKIGDAWVLRIGE